MNKSKSKGLCCVFRRLESVFESLKDTNSNVYSLEIFLISSLNNPHHTWLDKIEDRLAKAIEEKKKLKSLTKANEEKINNLIALLAKSSLEETPAIKRGDRVKRKKGSVEDKKAVGIVLYVKYGKARIQFNDRANESSIAVGNLALQE